MTFPNADLQHTGLRADDATPLGTVGPAGSGRSSGRLGPIAVLLAVLLAVAAACGDVSAMADESGSQPTGTAAAPATNLALQPNPLAFDRLAAPDVTVAEAVADGPTRSTGPADGSPGPDGNPATTGGPSLGTSGTAGAANAPVGDGDGSELAALITELPSAPVGEPAPRAPMARPTELTIESLGVRTAAVIGVGVEPNGDMEVPPADEVGWYQYGPSPGQQGSSVLAAHIAYDGRNGVFVNLDDIELGSIIEIAYDDGTTRRFEATDKQQYDKNDLPRESVFRRTGESQLVLITCGGDFNRNLRSYEDNVVVYAKPMA